MGIENCVFDTNILIYHLNDCLGEEAEQLLEKSFESGAYISVITRIEVLGWTEHTIESLTSAKDLLNRLHEQPLNDEFVRLCIQLRQTIVLKVPEAIIAATALYLDKPLMTRNIKDFQKVPGLKLFNPFSPTNNYKDCLIDADFFSLKSWRPNFSLDVQDEFGRLRLQFIFMTPSPFTISNKIC
jgi:predicted nucleic acid-binding protein